MTGWGKKAEDIEREKIQRDQEDLQKRASERIKTELLEGQKKRLQQDEEVQLKIMRESEFRDRVRRMRNAQAREAKEAAERKRVAEEKQSQEEERRRKQRETQAREAREAAERRRAAEERESQEQERKRKLWETAKEREAVTRAAMKKEREAREALLKKMRETEAQTRSAKDQKQRGRENTPNAQDQMKKDVRSWIKRPCFKPARRVKGPIGLHSRSQRRSSTANAPMRMQYQLPRLEHVEELEKYRGGGFHPIHLADRLKDGRYHILHKLGYGGFSTVWLALDEHLQRLVSLKVLTAEASQQQKELRILRYLDEHAQGNPRRDSIVSILDNFTIQGPNGTHMCYVSQVGGPSISQLSDSPGQVAGTRRLRAPLARKLAGQLANAVLLLHSLGTVHGDITPNNILLRLVDIDEWSPDDVYRQLDSPIKDEVFTFSGGKPGISAPEYVVQPTSFSSVAPRYISEEMLLIDLGEAFLESSSPLKGVGTSVSYCSPELVLEGKASSWSDVWALSCTMFEMRSGFPLFESFVGSSSEVLQEMVRILGTPPKPWWPSLEQHDIYIKQNEASRGSLLGERVREIGMNDEVSSMHGTRSLLSRPPASDPIIESPGTKIPEDEANSLAGLLQRTLAYPPEKRLPAHAIVKHRWFAK
ncbi:hypothetical protein MMC24_007861 [Lignoscripta atroalba]|nr:hypothetical protein [Lignoscripta atroalba]